MIMGAWGLGRKRSPTAKSYVQNGLIAMWDGIENAGWGTHDQAATTWKDLVGDNDITLTMGGGSWGSNALFVARTPKTTGEFRKNETTYKQIEVIGVELTQTMSYDRHILICFDSNHAFVIGQNRIGFCVANNVVGIDPTYPGSNNRANIPFAVSISYTDEDVPNPNGMYLNNVKKNQSGQSVGLSSLNNRFNNYSNYQADANIYCIRLYSRALTAEEIAANYAIDKKRFNLP